MRIGILKCGQSPEAIRAAHGDYDDMMQSLLGGRGFDFDSYHVEAMIFPAGVHAADGWLVTGSRHGVYEDHRFIPPLEDFIRHAYDAGVPMVGICFGHQIIAKALGGQVERYAGGWAVGAQTYDFAGRSVTLNAWHQDQVTRRPEGGALAGHNAFCENAALVYGDRAFTLQAHPEFRDDFIDALIEHRGGAVPGALIDAARTRRGTAAASGMADRIAAFFRQPRAGRRPAAVPASAGAA